MKKTLTILTSGILLFVLFATGCDNGLFTGGFANSADGNVTITIGTENSSRTIYPNDISTGSLSKIDFIFTKGDSIVTKTATAGQSSVTLTLEAGTWAIEAVGYVTLNSNLYEAARGTSSVVVTTSGGSGSVALKTGIFPGNPGVFNWNITFPAPANISEAVLKLTPFSFLSTVDLSLEKTIDLATTSTGSLETAPGYYMLSINAKDNSNKIALYSELVYIYSGLETQAAYTFVQGDFTSTVKINGSIKSGVILDNYVQSAVVTVYGDSKYVSRIASVQVPTFTLDSSEVPHYYRADFSVDIPSSFVGKEVYFRVEETYTGSANIGSYTWSRDHWRINVNSGSNYVNTFYTGFMWDSYGGPDMSLTMDDGFIVTEVTTHATSANKWNQEIHLSFPTKTDTKYVYVFEAWTESGSCEINLQYITNSTDGIYKAKYNMPVTTTPYEYVVVSDTDFTPNSQPYINFQIAPLETDQIGTFYIKIKNIIAFDENSQYVPPVVDIPLEAFTAVPTYQGIELNVDLTLLPQGITSIRFINVTTNAQFTEGNFTTRPDTYKILWPYVQANKEYTFELQCHGLNIPFPSVTVTSIGGRGEFTFTNFRDIQLIKNGNILKYDRTPQKPVFDERYIINERYAFQMQLGTSLNSVTSYMYTYDIEDPQNIDLLDVDKIPVGYNLVNVMGKTAFGEIYYQFDYDGEDIYLSGSPQQRSGYFRTSGIFSAPFVFPTKLFFAQRHAEGVRISVDKSLIAPGTGSLQVSYTWQNAANVYISSSEWLQLNGRFYNGSRIEFIFPFVEPGNTYRFRMGFGDDNPNTVTITPTAGLGELKYTNIEDVQLVYNDPYLSLTAKPIVSNIADSPKITEKRWSYTFWKGKDWDGASWIGSYSVDEPILSAPLDMASGIFDPVMAQRLSDDWAFVYLQASCKYDGLTFDILSNTIQSEGFMFPHWDPAGYSDTQIVETAFDTNSRLSLSYSSWVYGNEMWVEVRYNNYSSTDHVPVMTYMYFIDGVVLQNVTTETTSSLPYLQQATANLPTTGLSSGTHYGLVVVTIDGTAFSKEFSFRVGN